ncbi:hypothetical protein [Cronobacter sakazakii]|uniref:hypothetical protein n=1 Tax=Cronobacter sakazakii TaxID=28141 RepID=UPI0015E3A064|nr:hypothetical protein [Cronobacter sakazakii]EMC4150444.1 hypothetical protein [Cronobacter sakazakii]EMC4289104.1 hypothetical protein [Cronobacter sakazakii]
MSTISNERLEKLSEYDCADRYEVMSMATELLALRKEREKEESAVCPKCGNTGLADSGGVQPWGEPILIECDCTAPPAPGADDDSLPYDPQIAEYEQVMEAEQAQADTTSQQFESLAGKAVVTDENGNLPCPFCGGRCDPNGWMGSYDDGVPMCGPECEDCGATANSIEEWNRRSTALAGKAVGGSEGFECTPVADLYDLLTKCGECYDYTTSAKVAADWIKEGYSAREYVKLDRLQEAMTHGSSGESDGWIPCSKRMPDTYVNFL